MTSYMASTLHDSARYALTHLLACLVDGREASGARDAIEQPVGDRDRRADRVPHAHWQAQGECRQQDRDAAAARLTPTQHEAAPRRSPTLTHVCPKHRRVGAVAAERRRRVDCTRRRATEHLDDAHAVLDRATWLG